jgi:hypothetical protein
MNLDMTVSLLDVIPARRGQRGREFERRGVYPCGYNMPVSLLSGVF